MPTHPPTAQLRWPIALKGIASVVTGSVGLLSDALESVVNLFAAVTAYIVLGYAARPADKTHAFGHEKIEYFSSGLEGILIIVAGLVTAGYAIHRLIVPEQLEHLMIGTVLGLIAALVNFIVARILLVQGRRHRSIVLEADGKHLMADVWTTLGIVGGLVLVLFTGLAWLDPILAIVIGFNIAWTGCGLIVKSFNGLMDHALSPEEEEQIRAIIQATLPASATFHLLRTRRGGTRRFAEFHLLVEGEWSVRTAHHLAHKVEAALVVAVPGLEVTIHIEPEDEKDSWESEELKRLEQLKGTEHLNQPKREGDG
jgi:cation diffusion facilitator family transporter